MLSRFDACCIWVCVGMEQMLQLKYIHKRIHLISIFAKYTILLDDEWQEQHTNPQFHIFKYGVMEYDGKTRKSYFENANESNEVKFKKRQTKQREQKKQNNKQNSSARENFNSIQKLVVLCRIVIFLCFICSVFFLVRSFFRSFVLVNLWVHEWVNGWMTKSIFFTTTWNYGWKGSEKEIAKRIAVAAVRINSSQ